MNSPRSTVDFYKGKTIFLTGATGYVGRFLIYKILKEYDVKKIYILLRRKGKKSFEDRSDEYKNLELFSCFLPNKCHLSKIVPLEGDICEIDCGLTEEEQEIVEAQVDIVIHSAASIRFTAPLKSSALIHIKGTQNVIELAAKMKKLEVFIHMSSLSAWMNCDTVPESIPDCPHDPYGVSSRLQFLFECDSRDIESHYIGCRPKFMNSYSVTKSFAELVIDRNKHRFKKIAIVRPPFLVSCNSEPMTGWFDEPQEGVSLGALCSFGLCRIANIDPHQAIDVLPVDVCVNAILAITWYMVVKETECNMKIFNLSITNTTKCTGYDMLPAAIQLGYRYPSIKQIRPPIDLAHYPVTKSYVAVKSFFTHTLVSILVDLILWTMGHKPVLYRLTKKKISAISSIFQSLAEYKGEYKCEMKNIELLYGEKGALTHADRQMLSFDLNKINWYGIAEEGHLNFRRRVLNEPDDTLPSARKRLFHIAKFYQIFTYTLQFLLVYLVYNLHLILLEQNVWLWSIAASVTLYILFAVFIDIDESAFTLQPRAH